jgi:putative transposase
MRESQISPRRKSLRLPTRDYSQAGSYFVTICTHQKKCVLGSVESARVQLSRVGEIVRATWNGLPERFPRVVLDELVIMPNHLHAILTLVVEGLAHARSVNMSKMPAARRVVHFSLPDIIGAFKSISTIHVNRLLNSRGSPLWQKSYFEHVIRSGEDLKNAQRYILENPLKWSLDEENPGWLRK